MGEEIKVEKTENDEQESTVRLIKDDSNLIYASQTIIVATSDEFQLHFALQYANIGGNDTLYSTIKEVGKVFLTPKNTKILHKLLGEKIEKYEKKFGTIDIENKTTSSDEEVE